MDSVTQQFPENISISSSTTNLSLDYLIASDTPHTAESVKSISGVPQKGSVCPLSDSLYAETVSFSAIDAYTWKCRVSYSGNTLAQKAASSKYKWEDDPVIEYSNEFINVVVEKAYKDDEEEEPSVKLTNSAGDLYINPPTKRKMIEVISITWYTRVWVDQWKWLFLDSLNKNTIMLDGVSYSPKLLWMTELISNRYQYGTGKYCTKNFCQIKHNPDGWIWKPLQCGFNAVDPSDNKKKRVYINNATGLYTFNPDDKPITDAVLLNDDGTLLSTNALTMAQAEAKYGNYRLDKLADWSKLAIPTAKTISE